MQIIPRCKSLLLLRNSVNFGPTHFSSFHSTPILNEKWKKKWNSDFKRGQQPTKNYARYVIRQKRADTKAALKGLLYNCRDLGNAFQYEEPSRKPFGTSNRGNDVGGSSNSSKKKGRPKSDAHRAQKIHNHRMRRKFRKGSLSEDEDDCPETLFHATFGNRWYTWSFDSRSGSSQRSTPGFDWRENFHDTNAGQEEWESKNEAYDSEDETCNVGSCSDRAALGLPLYGPLRMKDVKTAFHSSALKWHPDKHQGSSQVDAGEKFKMCVSAYKSLCDALSA